MAPWQPLILYPVGIALAIVLDTEWIWYITMEEYAHIWLYMLSAYTSQVAFIWQHSHSSIGPTITTTYIRDLNITLRFFLLDFTLKLSITRTLTHTNTRVCFVLYHTKNTMYASEVCVGKYRKHLRTLTEVLPKTSQKWYDIPDPLIFQCAILKSW